MRSTLSAGVLTTRIFGLRCRHTFALLVVSLFCHSWEDGSSIPLSKRGTTEPVISRDYVATTIAYGEGLKKNLLVNGYPMTSLDFSCKVMAHVPLALLKHPPKSALVICFGMGTSFRSALCWDIPVTVVDLVPGIPKMFPYFWKDASQVLKDPHGQIVVDDGRRFLARNNEKFDIITVDPPQPLGAAGSSLLYSKEFYSVVKDHLNSGGIFQEYMPRIDDAVLSGATRSLEQSFRYVKIYELIGNWGYHILASNEPFQELSADQLLAKMPVKARADFEELLTDKDKDAGLLGILTTLFSQEQDVPKILAKTANNVTLDDDRPLNEYFILRNEFGVGNLLQNGAKNTPVQAPLPD